MSKKKVSDLWATIGPISQPVFPEFFGNLELRKRALMIASLTAPLDRRQWERMEQERLWQESDERDAAEFGITVEMVRELDASSIGPVRRAMCRANVDDMRKIVELAEEWIEKDKQ